MSETNNLLLAYLKRYWHLLLLFTIPGLLIPGPMIAALVTAIVSILVYRKSHTWASPWVFRLFIVGLGLRIAIILVKFAVHQFFGGRLSIFGDSEMYLGESYEVFTALLGNWDASRLTPGNYGYSIVNWLYGAMYLMVGPSAFMLHIFNALFCCLAALLIYLLTMRICSHHPSALMAMSLTLFFPSQIMWSVEMLKEPLIQCCVALILYLFVDMITGRKWVYLLPLAVLWYPLGHLRRFSHFVMLSTLVLSGILAIPRKLRVSLAIILVLGVAFTIRLGPAEIHHYWELGKDRVVGTQIGFITTGGSWYRFIPERFNPGMTTPQMTIVEFGLSYLKAVGYYLLVPFPSLNISFNKVWALPQIFIWYILLFGCLIPGVLYLVRYHFRVTAVVIVYLFFFTSVQALFTGNEGTAFRQRDTLTIFYFIPMALGFFNLKGWLTEFTSKLHSPMKYFQAPSPHDNQPNSA